MENNLSKIASAVLMCSLLAACNSSSDPKNDVEDTDTSLLPITPDGEWTYVPVDDAICGDGSSYGLALNRNSQSDKLLIFMNGGGWCWNENSCQSGQFNITEYTFSGMTEQEVLDVLNHEKTGILARDEQDNPFRDYNLAFLPYCSGDMHFGTAGATDYGVEHHGANNTAAFMRRLVPSFSDVSEVVLTGVSAGALGALLNYDQVQTAFGKTPVSLVTDSAPPLPTGVINQELTDAFWQAWAPAFPDDCTNCRDFYSWLTYLERKYPGNAKAFVTSSDDWLLRRLWGMNIDGTVGEDMSAEDYNAALTATASAMAQYPNTHIFIDNNDQHVYMDKEIAYLADADGKPLMQWLGEFASHAPTWTSAIDLMTQSNAGGVIFGGEKTPDVQGDEQYSYPTAASFSKQMDILNVTTSQLDGNLSLSIEMAEITDTWAPPYGFDHASLSIYIDLPNQAGVSVLPNANAQAPTNFSWNLFHQLFGWSSSVYSAENADANTQGTLLSARPNVSVDKTTRTITVTYLGTDLGVTDWTDAQVYITTWDIDGLSENYRDISPEGGDYVFGGAPADSAKIMDDVGPFSVPSAPETTELVEGDTNYPYPFDPSFGNQQDLTAVSYFSREGSLEVLIKLAEVTDIWAAPNGFDHLSISAYIGSANEAGISELPHQNASMPNGLTWSTMIQAYGWGKNAYSANGASADNYGEYISEGFEIEADSENGTLLLRIPASTLGNKASLDGSWLYITTWDIDGLSEDYHKLNPEGGNWEYTGAVDSPKVQDSVLINIRE